MSKNTIFPTDTSISLDHNNYQQSIFNSTSNDNINISPGHNYQQPISNDSLNNDINISSRHNYQQSMPNDASTPQFHPQYINQNSSQSNVPLLNSLGIIINSPHTNIIIMPITSSDIRNLLQQNSF